MHHNMNRALLCKYSPYGLGKAGRWGIGYALRLALLAPAFALPLFACSTAPEMPQLSRESFVEVYVALRLAELRSGDVVIPEAVRDSVLAEHGVNEAGLRTFAVAHGRDAAFMEALWTEVQDRVVEATSQTER